jgi:hypothetical protein
LRLREVDPGRLFADDVLARGETVARDGQELRDGNAHQDHLDIAPPEQFMVIGDVVVHRKIGEGGELFRRRPRAIGERDDAESISHSDERRPMELLDGEAGANDAEPNRSDRR